jgi:hypothetical protein
VSTLALSENGFETGLHSSSETRGKANKVFLTRPRRRTDDSIHKPVTVSPGTQSPHAVGDLREAFAIWQRVALAKDSALRAADHEKHVRLCLLPPAPGAGMCGATRDALLRRRLWTREF